MAKKHVMEKWNAPKAFRDEIERIFEYFQHRMGLGEYEMRYAYFKKLPVKDHALGASMQIVVDSVYLTMEVDIGKRVYDEGYHAGSWRQIAQIIVHELCHALTDPYYEMCANTGDTRTREVLRTLNERQTERIMKAIFSFVSEKDFKDYTRKRK